jgi:biopolymer transport protein TolQ
VIANNRASGDLNEYASTLSTLTGIVEVQLSRQIDAGDPVVDAADGEGRGKSHDKPVQAVHRASGSDVRSIATQGA